MTLLEQPNSSTTFSGFLLELRDRHQICCNLCKTAVPQCNPGCLIHPPGKTIKGYQPRPCCFSRTSLIMAKICGSTICSDNKEHFFLFVVWSPSSQSNIFFTCDIATCPWLCKVCTTYNREWSSSKFLHYLAHSREQNQKLKLSHTESCLQCKAQGVFIVQMPIMKSTQISPRAFSSKINAKAFIHN